MKQPKIASTFFFRISLFCHFPWCQNVAYGRHLHHLPEYLSEHSKTELFKTPVKNKLYLSRKRLQLSSFSSHIFDAIIYLNPTFNKQNENAFHFSKVPYATARREVHDVILREPWSDLSNTSTIIVIGIEFTSVGSHKHGNNNIPPRYIDYLLSAIYEPRISSGNARVNPAAVEAIK